jgi:PKD repeat protein
MNEIVASGNDPFQDSCIVPTFDQNGDASSIGVTNENSGVLNGVEFTGSSGTTGMFLNHSAFPEEYHSLYLQTDIKGWLKAFRFNEEYDLTEMQNWSDEMGFIVHQSLNPKDGSVYFCSLFPIGIYKLSFNGNLSPVIQLEQDTVLGVSPLEVSFDASSSFDPDNDPITFEWDFGDGQTGTGVEITHTYQSDNNGPASFETVLTVRDSANNISKKEVLVSLNNSHPQAEITSISPDYLYSIEEPTVVPLEASIFDLESNLEDLFVEWKLYLHHNTHFHLERTLNSFADEVTIQPLGCGLEVYWYRIDLTVSDPQGLTTRKSIEFFPDCEGGQGFSEELIIYPNPTSGRFTVTYPSLPGEIISLTIYNSQGELVTSQSADPRIGENKRVYDFQKLPAGLYHLEFKTQNWNVNEKLIVTDSD